MKKYISLFSLLALFVLSLAACTKGSGEIATMVPSETAEVQVSTQESGICLVHNVDQLLSALNSNTVISLSEGSFRLDQASDYGKDSDNPAYYWEPTEDGWQLVLNHLHDLTIVGQGQDLSCLLTSPRFSNILSLAGCKRIQFENFTAGHTEEAEMCSGGVIQLDDCEDVTFRNVGLFGCGIQGLRLKSCDKVQAEDCDIYDCSFSAISADSCRNLTVRHSNFYTLGSRQEPAMSIFDLMNCQDVLLEDCSVSENNIMQLLYLEESRDISLKSMEFRANRIMAYAFQFVNCSPVFDQCTFEGNDLRRWYESMSQMAVDKTGSLIGNEQLPPIPEISRENLPSREQIHVSTANEFLRALGSDREIILDCPLLNLSTASDYGTGSSPYYSWEETYDGPQLVIANVSNLQIIAEGPDKKAHTISAVPRYANVLAFRQCQDVLLSGFTAGHTEALGECSGGVLDFQDCDGIEIRGCGLFGCGILGVQARFCSCMNILDNHIYECSFGGISLWGVNKITITGNTFRALGGPNVEAQQCEEIRCDVPVNDYGEALN